MRVLVVNTLNKCLIQKPKNITNRMWPPLPVNQYDKIKKRQFLHGNLCQRSEWGWGAV